MTNAYRLTQSIKAEELEYSLDKYDQYGILEIYSDQLDVEALKTTLQKQYELTDILVKENFDGKKTLISGDCPEKVTVIENDLKFLVQLKQDEPGLPLSKSELRNLIKDYSSNKEVLDLFGFTGVNSIYAASVNPKSVSIVESDTKQIQKIKKNFEINSFELPQIWDLKLNDFLELASESRTKWDLIVMDLSSYNASRMAEFNVLTDHRDLIKLVQQRLLKESGILIVVADQKDFVLDQYIRPGADKLTNQIIPEEFKPLKPNQAFAFYN